MLNVWPPTVIEPVRGTAVFTSTVNCTVPESLPLAPVVMWIHPSDVLADHAHPVVVVTLKNPEPPAAAISADEGEIANVQPLACVAVNVCPPAEIVAARAGPVFAAAVKLTVPFPEPLEPPVICSHPSLEAADHEQDPGAVMEKLPVPPPASKP